MNVLSKIAQWLYSKRRGVLETITWASIGLLLYTGHVYISYALLFTLSIVKIKPISPAILLIAKNAYIIKFYNIVIWFFSYIIALKLISYQTGIEESNLKFAPAIMAIPLSLILVFCLVMIFTMSMIVLLQIFSYFTPFMTAKIKKKIVESKFYLFSTRSFYVIPLLAPVLIIIASVSDPVFKVALLADSSFISDCGVKQKDKMYIRIDSHSCLASTLDMNVFRAKPEVIQSEK